MDGWKRDSDVNTLGEMSFNTKLYYNLRGPRTDVVESWTELLQDTTHSFSMVTVP